MAEGTTRKKSLEGSPSPFLDSGFHFGNNIDVTINLPGPQHKRLNMVNVVMALQGLSQMGDGRGASYDQEYITIGEYVKYFYPKTAEEKKALYEKEDALLVANREFDPDKIMDKIRDRLTDMAQQWFKNEAPKKFKWEIAKMKAKDKVMGFISDHLP